MYYSNYDLENVVTPVKIDCLTQLLIQTGYPPPKIDFLEQGFRHGFDIGYQGPQDCQSTSENINFTVGNEIQLWNKYGIIMERGEIRSCSWTL